MIDHVNLLKVTLKQKILTYKIRNQCTLPKGSYDKCYKDLSLHDDNEHFHNYMTNRQKNFMKKDLRKDSDLLYVRLLCIRICL